MTSRMGVEPQVRFSETEVFGRWIGAQPHRPDVAREFSHWTGIDLKVTYVDDTFPNAEKRRRVLFSEGQGSNNSSLWGEFAGDSLRSGCTYLELFTTDRDLDRSWAELGAWQYPDPPVLVAWGKMEPRPVLLHGWDRENWTYLADDKSLCVERGVT